MNKKGISTIVATVLIVLITVAAVTILWAAISPMIGQDMDRGVACFQAQNALTIDTDRRYSCYYNDTQDIKFRVQRTSADANIVAAEVYHDVNGATGTVEKLEEGTSLPNPNTAKTGDIQADSTMDENSVVRLAVAPVIMIGGEEVSCERTQFVEIRTCP